MEKKLALCRLHMRESRFSLTNSQPYKSNGNSWSYNLLTRFLQNGRVTEQACSDSGAPLQIRADNLTKNVNIHLPLI